MKREARDMTSNFEEASVGLKLKEAVRHAIIFGLGSIAQSATQFLLIPILTATLIPAQLGAYYLIQMASTIAGAIFYLGMTSALPRSYFDYSDEVNRRSVFTTAFIVISFGAIIQVLLGTLGGGLISRLMLRNEVYRTAVQWAFIGNALSFINQFFFSYLRFLRRSIFSVVLGLLALIGSMGISIALLKVNPSDISAPFKGQAIAQMIIIIVFIIKSGKKIFYPRIFWKEIPILLKFGIPTIFSSFAFIVMDQADRILIGRMLSMSEVGIYSVAYKLSSVINVVLIVPFGQIFSPMMIEYRKQSNIKSFFNKVFSYYCMACFFCIVITAFFAKDLLPIVARGSSYSSVTPIIVIVMLGYAAYGVINIVSAGLIYQRKIIISTVIYWVCAGTKIMLNLLVIPRWGMFGAAGVTFIIYILLPLLISLASHKYFSFPIELNRIFRCILISLIPILFAIFLEPIFSFSLIIKLIFFLVFCVFFYFFCFKEQERVFILSLIKKNGSR
jgi:O-antigen/teichoic acid export membrane protein